MIMQSYVRQLSALILALFFVSMPALAQGDDDDYDFSEIPVEEEERPYIGVGGGYQLMVTLFDRTALDSVSESLGMGGFDGPLYIHGGGGFTAVGIVENMRLGVYGGGGSKVVTAQLGTGDTSYDRSLRFTSGYTAVHLDYAIPVFGRLTVAPGFMIGGGRTTLEYAQTAKSATFGTIFDPVALGGGSSSTLNRQATAAHTFLFLYPALNIEYALTQFILLRVGGGYAFDAGRAFGGNDTQTWDDGHGAEIKNVPNGLTASGPTLNVGLFLGLFQQ